MELEVIGVFVQIWQFVLLVTTRRFGMTSSEVKELVVTLLSGSKLGAVCGFFIGLTLLAVVYDWLRKKAELHLVKERVAFKHMEDPYDWWREIKAFVQRGLYGYADTDFWDYDRYLLTVLSTSLEQFADNTTSIPGGVSSGAWKRKLHRVAAMLRESRSRLYGYDENRPLFPCSTIAMRYFAKVLHDLWQ